MKRWPRRIPVLINISLLMGLSNCGTPPITIRISDATIVALSISRAISITMGVIWRDALSVMGN